MLKFQQFVENDGDETVFYQEEISDANEVFAYQDVASEESFNLPDKVIPILTI